MQKYGLLVLIENRKKLLSESNEISPGIKEILKMNSQLTGISGYGKISEVISIARDCVNQIYSNVTNRCSNIDCSKIQEYLSDSSIGNELKVWLQDIWKLYNNCKNGNIGNKDKCLNRLKNTIDTCIIQRDLNCMESLENTLLSKPDCLLPPEQLQEIRNELTQYMQAKGFNISDVQNNNSWIKSHPYQTAGIGLAAGAGLGFLIWKLLRNKNSSQFLSKLKSKLFIK